MNKTINDVTAALKKLDDGNDLVEVVTKLSQEAASNKNGFDTLNSTHNTLVGQLKELGYSGGDAGQFLKDTKSKLDRIPQLEKDAKAATDKLTADQQTIKKLQDSIDGFQDALTKERDARTKSEAAANNSVLKEALLQHMPKRIFGANFRADALIQSGEVVLGEGRKPMFKKGEGNLVPIEQGLEEYYQRPENKDDLKNTQGDGAGGTGGEASGGTKLTMAEFEKKTEDEKREFLKNKANEVITA